MKILWEKYWDFSMETHTTFVGLKKAFHRIKKTKILETLQNHNNIPQQILKNLYNL
jgi:hypothetical protein